MSTADELLEALVGDDTADDDCTCKGVAGDLKDAFMGEVRSCPVHDRRVQRDPMPGHERTNVLRGVISSPGASTEEIAGALGMRATGARYDDQPPSAA